MGSRYLALLMLCIIVLSVIPIVSAENTATTLYVSNSGSDKNSGLTADKPKKTIQNAIKHIKSGGTIHVKSGTYKENLKIKTSVQLIGEGPNNTTIDGKQEGTCIYINGKKTVLIKGFKITNGKVRINGGGGINSYRVNLTVQNCLIQNNKAEKYFWNYFLYDPSSEGIIEDTITLYSDGGGISCSEGSLLVENSTIQNNSAIRDGGGISCSEGSLLVENSTIQNNSAIRNGGGIFCYGGALVVRGSLIQLNSAKNGGGIYHANCFMEVVDSKVINNLDISNPDIR